MSTPSRSTSLTILSSGPHWASSILATTASPMSPYFLDCSKPTRPPVTSSDSQGLNRQSKDDALGCDLAFRFKRATRQLQAQPGATVRKNVVLIDFENVQPASLGALWRDLRVLVFVGATPAKLSFDAVSAIQHMGERAQYTIKSQAPSRTHSTSTSRFTLERLRSRTQLPSSTSYPRTPALIRSSAT